MSVFQWLSDSTSSLFSGGATSGGPSLQTSGMLSREQLLQLFVEFSTVLEKPEIKSRISDAVKAKQEAVSVTTEIQEELLKKMGVEPKFGITCLAKVNSVYKDDRELMLKFYEFVSREEMACDEAELGPEAFQQKMQQFKKIQEQQLRMLQQVRGLPVDQQRSFIQGLQSQMLESKHEVGSAVMTPQQIQEFFQRQHQSASAAQRR